MGLLKKRSDKKAQKKEEQKQEEAQVTSAATKIQACQRGKNERQNGKYHEMLEEGRLKRQSSAVGGDNLSQENVMQYEALLQGFAQGRLDFFGDREKDLKLWIENKHVLLGAFRSDPRHPFSRAERWLLLSSITFAVLGLETLKTFITQRYFEEQIAKFDFSGHWFLVVVFFICLQLCAAAIVVTFQQSITALATCACVMPGGSLANKFLDSDRLKNKKRALNRAELAGIVWMMICCFLTVTLLILVQGCFFTDVHPMAVLPGILITTFMTCVMDYVGARVEFELGYDKQRDEPKPNFRCPYEGLPDQHFLEPEDGPRAAPQESFLVFITRLTWATVAFAWSFAVLSVGYIAVMQVELPHGVFGGLEIAVHSFLSTHVG